MSKWGVVIPSSENRLKNLRNVLINLYEGSEIPDHTVVVCDGWGNNADFDFPEQERVLYVGTEKYQPDGKHNQPRNIGVQHLRDDIDYVWFLDSDCIPGHRTLEAYKKAMAVRQDRVLIGPYDWLPPNKREPMPLLHNDPRTEMFELYDPLHVAKYDLGFALACFSGNLVWPIEQFKSVGGFWNEINMGRCEDGELGLRAASLGMPMSVVPDARAWHLYHDVNHEWVEKQNKRDVPKINERHPWVEEEGIIVAEKDGARFDIVCQECGEQINTLEIWEHKCQKNS